MDLQVVYEDNLLRMCTDTYLRCHICLGPTEYCINTPESEETELRLCEICFGKIIEEIEAAKRSEK